MKLRIKKKESDLQTVEPGDLETEKRHDYMTSGRSTAGQKNN